MPTPTEQLLSRTVYATDGTTLNWDFSFSGGYLLPAHVKAFTEVPATGQRTEVVVTEPMLIGPYQLRISPALASGLNLTIYRDTPKDLPLVDFTDESGFSEVSLDTNAKQAVFVAAETTDTVNTSSSYEAEQAAIEAAVSAAAALASQNAANASAIAAANAAATIVLPLTISSGGTGGTTAATARTALSAAASGVNNDITKLNGITAWKSGDVIQERVFSDVGNFHVNTLFDNLTAGTKNITPKSTTSTLYILVTFLGGVNPVSGTNTIGTFQLYEAAGGGLFGVAPNIQAPSGPGGTGIFAPIAIAGILSNTALTPRGFTLQGKTSISTALVQATQMIWSIREIQN